MLKSVTRGEIVFELGGKQVTVQGEALSPTPGMPSYVIYANSIERWDPPNDKTPMTALEKYAVLEGIKEALQNRGTIFDVEDEEQILAAAASAGGRRLRCEAGQPCPREGWWFTPAGANSRRHFKAGELMPDLKSDYGATIWQWDEQQQ
jgi:hypothetical protein